MPVTGRPRGRPGERLEPAPEPKSAFQFPRMPFSEIQDDMNMNNFDCPISKEEFRAPAPADIRRVTDFFISEIYWKRPEDFAQPSFGCLDQVEFPELYEDAIPQFNYLRQCQKMFEAAQFEEFGIRDLHAPEKNRFHWELSALINLHKFRQTRLAMIEEVVGNFDEMAEREQRNNDERIQLERDISVIEEARAKDEPEVESLREHVAELGIKLGSLHKQQIELTDRTRDAKTLLTKRTEHAAAVKVKRMSEMEDVDRYRMRVVSSPDRVKAEMEEMAENLATEKQNVNSMERRTRTLRMRTDAIGKTGHAVEKAGNAMDVVLVEQERAKGLQREIDERRSLLKENEREITAIKNSQGHLARVVNSVQQKLARVGDQNTDVNRQTGEEDRALAEKEAHFDQEQALLSKEVDNKNVAVKAIKERIVREVTNFSEEVTEFARKQAEMGEKMGAYHADLKKARDIISEDNSKSFGVFKETR